MAKTGTSGKLVSLLWLCRAASGSAFAFESGTVGIVFSGDPGFQLVSVLKRLDLDSETGGVLPLNSVLLVLPWAIQPVWS